MCINEQKQLVFRVETWDESKRLEKCKKSDKILGTISGRLLVFDFQASILNVSVTVINRATTKVIYWDLFDMIGYVNVDMANEEPGDYIVRLTSTEWCLKSPFTIE